MHVVEAALKGKHVEAHAFVQKLHQPALGQEGRSVAVTLFTEHHDSSRSNRLAQRLQIREIPVGGRNRPNSDRMRTQVCDADVRRSAGMWSGLSRIMAN